MMVVVDFEMAYAGASAGETCRIDSALTQGTWDKPSSAPRDARIVKRKDACPFLFHVDDAARVVLAVEARATAAAM